MEPSLTLSMPDDTTTVTATATASGGGGHSVSSLSVGVKRERLEDAADLGEMVSSTAAAEDEDDGSTRKKLRLTKEQSALLEDRFKEHSTLNPVRTSVVRTYAYRSRLML
jgi:homeobox-leucine zipper protein